MDEQSAKKLLSEVRGQEKQAIGGAGIGGTALNSAQSSKPPALPAPEIDWGKVQDDASSQSGKNRTGQIIQGLLLAGAAGAGLRGLVGLNRMAKEIKPRPSKTVDMEVPFPVVKEEEEEKSAESSVVDRLFDNLKFGPKSEPRATHNTGVPYYIPAMMLGLPAAGIAGWKGMDAIFDKQRKRQSQRQLDAAKEEYEEELLGSYKQGSDSAVDKLDKVFESFEKAAYFEIPGTGNVSGQLKGLLATYALLSGPAAYMYVNDKMKKNSQKAILEKAVKERSRRAAQQQPLELYATPKPVEIEPEEDN